MTTPRRALMLLAFAATLSSCGTETPPAPPPPNVKVAIVLQRDVPVYLEAIGETRGNTETDIRARVEGYIEKVTYQEGTEVTKGQLLYILDPRPFEEALAQAKAELARAQAEWTRRKQDVARFEPLVADNAVSREEYETAMAQETAAAATVDAARSAERAAALNLGYTRVLATEGGLIGKTEVQAGTLVGRGLPTLLTRISQIDPIHVRFTVAEQDYLRLARARPLETSPGDADTPPLEMVLADGSKHPHPGSVVFVDRNVDAETGTILIEASFPNPERIVRPGQYARVRAAITVRKGALLVPQRAVAEMQGTFSVAVVKTDDTIEMRTIKPAERVGGLWVVGEGLQPGERIVVEGLQKVRQGAKVTAEQVAIDEGAAAGSNTAPGA
jgi:membrane fusion protein (multidrug efflux system)